MALSQKAKVDRKKFTKKYSRKTAAIVRLYAMKRHLDWRSNEIGSRLTVNPRSVAATLANLTRGTYSPFADIPWFTSSRNVVGTCKY